MKTVSRHLIAEFYGCASEALDQIAVVREHLMAAAREVGATVVNDAFHRFSPMGVSGVVVIAESHLAVHTWPGRGYAAVDIFTCGGLDPRPGCELLAGRFEAESYRVQEILRGLPDELADHGLLMPEDVRLVTETPELHRPPRG